MNQTIQIDTTLVQKLITTQFPQWADLVITPVQSSGWDNRTFHLGEHMLVRLPSRAEYASQVEIEQRWLPKLAPYLPLAVPKPIAMGKPTNSYPFHWSVFEWLDGATVTVDRIKNLAQFAIDLAEFLNALQQCNSTNGPIAGPHSFYRGCPLSTYDDETRKAIADITDKKLAQTLTAIWDRALESTWQHKPVWVHGDIAVANLLLTDGKLSAVIDFGQLCIGDPACDLAIYWTFLSGQSQKLFRQIVNLDNDTWDRARGWVLWKTLCAPIAGTDTKRIINALIYDFV